MAPRPGMGSNAAAAVGVPHTPTLVHPLVLLTLLAAVFSTSVSAQVQDVTLIPSSSSTIPSWQGGASSPANPTLYIPTTPSADGSSSSPPLNAYSVPVPQGGYQGPVLGSSPAAGDDDDPPIPDSSDPGQPPPQPQPSTFLKFDFREGSPCSLNPATDPEPMYCETSLVCYPRRRTILGFGTTSSPGTPYSTSAAAAAPGTQPDASGLCAEPHPGVIVPRAYPTPWPTPAAYYPLSKDLDSFPAGSLSGTFHRTTFDSQDRRWGGTLTCDAASASFAALQSPPGFGQRGRLAVSVWVKLPAAQSSSKTGSGSGSAAANEQTGGAYQYVLSLARAGTSGSAGANQVSILIPRPGHPKFGTVRAVVRDGDDATMPETFLDSDGTTSNTLGASSASSPSTSSTDGTSASSVLQGPKPAANPNVANVWDGEWHHMVVSTIPPVIASVRAGLFPRGSGVQPLQGSGVSGWQVQRGYMLFVDGVMRAELRPEDDSVPSDSSSTKDDDVLDGGLDDQGEDSVSGGDASTLDGPIYLCSRADRDPLLFFTGQLAQLQLFDEALSPAAVSSLFMEFRRQALIYPKGEIVPTGGRSSVRNARCVLPLSYAGQLQYQCLVLPQLTTSTSNPSNPVALLAQPQGPACLTGPRGDWELCGESSRSTNPQYVSVTDGTDAAAVAAVIDVAEDVDGSGANAKASLNKSLPDSSSAAGTGPEQEGTGETVSAAVQARLAAAAGSTVYSYSPYLPRYTMSGQACMTAPYWLGGKLVQAGQCATAGGQEVCPVPRPQGYSSGGSTAGSDGKSSVSDQYDLLQCDLMVAVPASSTYCFLAASPTLPDDLSVFEESDSESTPGGSSSIFEVQYSGMQTPAGVQNSQTAERLFEGCVSQGGLEFCKIRGQGGPWLLCPAGKGPVAALGTPCQMPFRYGSTARSDCVAPMQATDSTSSAGLSSNLLYCPIDTDSTGAVFTSTDSMQVCSKSAAFTAATLEQGDLLSLVNPATAPWGSGSSVLRDPTAPVPGLPASQEIPLNGLVSAQSSGARRYSLFTKQACLPLPAATSALQTASAPSSVDSGSVSALGRRGGASAVDGASAAASPSAGEASCIVNSARGQFECRTAVTPGAAQTSSSGSGVLGQWEICAPVARTTISGNKCLLPFKWLGSLRDDCVWHNGMEVCPVLATTATGAVPDKGLAAVEDAMNGGGDALFPPQSASHDFAGSGLALPSSSQGDGKDSAGDDGSGAQFAAVAAAGPWRWEQCTKDYATMWDRPPSKQLQVERFGVSAAACIFPFIYQGQSHWSCINSSTPGTSSSSSSSSSSGSDDSTATTPANKLTKVLTNELSGTVCPIATGGWEVCAPKANITRYTFNGGLCNLPFAHHGKLEYDCLGASNGTAGLCKDAAGAWQACVATHRRGKVSSKPCILPATISARDGFVSGAGITAASSAGGGDTGDAADDTDATDSAASIGGADDKQMLVTDCFWQQQEASGQQQQQYKEVCYTDAETLEECTTSGYGLTGSTTLGLRRPGIGNQLANALKAGALKAAAASPQSASSNSRLVPLAVGIAVGIGGTLLLLLVLATVAVKRGLVYQWRSNRFHEMQLDPELPGHESAGFSRGGGKFAAGFTTTKDWMTQPRGKTSSSMQGDTAPAGPFEMQDSVGEVISSPNKRMKLTPFAAVGSGLSSAGSLLQRLLSSSSSTGPSGTLLPPGSMSSTPLDATAAGSTGAGNASSCKGAPGSPSSSSSSSQSTAGSRPHCVIELQSSKSISSSNSAKSPVKEPAAATQYKSSGAANAGSTTAAVSGADAAPAAAAAATPFPTSASPAESKQNSKAGDGSGSRASPAPAAAKTISTDSTSTNPFYQAAAAEAAAAVAATAAGHAVVPFPAPSTAAAAPASNSAGNAEPDKTLNPFSADAAAFDASQRPCYQAQLSGVPVNAVPTHITAAAAATGSGNGRVSTAAVGDNYGVDGAVGSARRGGAVGLGSMVGARILQLAGTGAGRRAGSGGNYAAWDGGKSGGKESEGESGLGGNAGGDGSSSEGEGGDANGGVGESATAQAPAAAATAATAGKKGDSRRLAKVLHPIATRQREEVEAAERVGREVAAAAAANPPGAPGGSGLL